MGTLLNRRRYMGGGSSLPYDAEIEYLESTGTQWIDTGVDLKKIVVMSAEISITKTITTNSMVFGVYYDNSNYPRFQIYINSQCKWSSDYPGYYNYSGITKGGTVSIGTKYTPVVTSTSLQNSNATILLFARNNDRGGMLPIDGMRLYSSHATYDNTLARDYIPVRVGQTGYLYDKVSGRLFGNAGTDPFILGPDKQP